MSRIRLVVIACALAILPAGAQAPSKVWSIENAPREWRVPVSRADLVVVSLQQALLAELTEELEKGGPGHAIDVCHLEATGVAYRIAREQNIATGRTSDRLRNPTNAPRPWAAPIVAAHAGRKASKVNGFVVDLGDRLGVLRPIAHQPVCGNCHGPADRLNPAVRAALAERYPADQALGFRDGEIRGWFWVEIPKVSDTAK